MCSRLFLSVVLALALLTWGCATGMPAGAFRRQAEYLAVTPAAIPRGIPNAARLPRPHPPPGSLRGTRDDVVAWARSQVGRKQVQLGGKTYPSDCTGLVSAVYEQLGLQLLSSGAAGENGVTAIYRYAQQYGRIYEGGRPLPGDLVFFRETYDVNRDGRSNDGLTHVGLVDTVENDGTVQIIHRVSRGVVRYRMNIDRRHERKDAATGRILNDALRAAGAGESTALTGELFAAYATLFPTASAVARK